MLQICPVSFDASTPSLETIIKEAERLGSLELASKFTDGFPDCCELAFVTSPESTLSLLVKPDKAQVVVTHMAGSAPSLNRLIHETLARLGGKHPFQHKALPLPLTRSNVARYDSKERFSVGVFSIVICAVILVAVVAAICLALAVCWGVVRTVMAALELLIV